MALAVPAWISQQIAARAFYARGDTWRPMVLGTVVALAAIPLYLAMGKALGVLGIAAAGVIGMTVNALATLLLARWLHGAPDLGRLAATTARASGIALVAAAAAYLVVAVIAAHTTSRALGVLAISGVLFSGIVFAGTMTIGDEAMREALQRVLRRVRRRAGDA